MVSQPFALANDYTADLAEVPGFGFTAGSAVGSASLSAFASISIPDTVLDDQQYEVRLERYGDLVPIVRISDSQK